MKFFFKNKFIVLIYFFGLVLLPLLSVNAFSPLVDGMNEIDKKTILVAKDAGYDGNTSKDTAAEIVATVIKAFLGLLGVIFIFLVVIAGYKYMTANGDEGQVEDALGSIKTAVIGLIIIVSAYAITAFVFKNISTDGSSGGGGSTSK